MARIARRLLQKKQQLDRYRQLEPFTVQRLHQELRLLSTYHSTAIEGNTLSLRETQMVLEYGITVDGHPLREYLEATNHAEAFDTLPKLVERPITVATVETLHRLVMAKIDPHAGEVRTIPSLSAGRHSPRHRPEMCPATSYSGCADSPVTLPCAMTR